MRGVAAGVAEMQGAAAALVSSGCGSSLHLALLSKLAPTPFAADHGCC